MWSYSTSSWWHQSVPDVVISAPIRLLHCARYLPHPRVSISLSANPFPIIRYALGPFPGLYAQAVRNVPRMACRNSITISAYLSVPSQDTALCVSGALPKPLATLHLFGPLFFSSLLFQRGLDGEQGLGVRARAHQTHTHTPPPPSHPAARYHAFTQSQPNLSSSEYAPNYPQGVMTRK